MLLIFDITVSDVVICPQKKPLTRYSIIRLSVSFHLTLRSDINSDNKGSDKMVSHLFLISPCNAKAKKHQICVYGHSWQYNCRFMFGDYAVLKKTEQYNCQSCFVTMLFKKRRQCFVCNINCDTKGIRYNCDWWIEGRTICVCCLWNN